VGLYSGGQGNFNFKKLSYYITLEMFFVVWRVQIEIEVTLNSELCHGRLSGSEFA